MVDLEGGETCTCPICLESFLPLLRVFVLKCEHVFCSSCLQQWSLSSSTHCPSCRQNIAPASGEVLQACGRDTQKPPSPQRTRQSHEKHSHICSNEQTHEKQRQRRIRLERAQQQQAAACQTITMDPSANKRMVTEDDSNQNKCSNERLERAQSYECSVSDIGTDDTDTESDNNDDATTTTTTRPTTMREPTRAIKAQRSMDFASSKSIKIQKSAAYNRYQ